MNGAEVRKLSNEEIGLEIERLRARLFTLRTQVSTEKVEDLSQFGKTRKDIARLLTERTARRLREAAAKAPAKPGDAAATAAPKSFKPTADPASRTSQRTRGRARLRGGSVRPTAPAAAAKPAGAKKTRTKPQAKA